MLAAGHSLSPDAAMLLSMRPAEAVGTGADELGLAQHREARIPASLLAGYSAPMKLLCWTDGMLSAGDRL